MTNGIYSFIRDEVYFVGAAENVIKSGKIFTHRGTEYALWHPPLYVYSLAGMFELFGIGFKSARAFGALCFLISLILIYHIALYVAPKNKNMIAALSCFIYTLCPMAIQGSLLIDIDNNLLNMLLLAFIFLFCKAYPFDRIYSLIATGVLFAVLIWSKLTIIPFLLVSLSIFGLLTVGIKRSLYIIGIISGTGIMVFSLSWWTLCMIKDWPILSPFMHIINSISIAKASGSFTQVGFTLAKYFVRLVLWISPFFLILGLMAVVARIRNFCINRKLEYIDLLTILSVLFLGYLYIGGTSFSFPKYFYPMLAPLSIVIAWYISSFLSELKTNDILFFIVIGIALLIYDFAIVGDLLYASYHIIREAIVNGASVRPIFTKLIFKGCLYLLPIVLVCVVLYFMNRGFKTSIVTAIFIVMFAGNLSLNMLQAKADYLTIYGYGGKGTKRLINYLKKNVEIGDHVFATGYISYYVRGRISQFYTDSIWNDKQDIMKIILQQQPEYVVYGLPSNTTQQIMNLLNDQDVRTFLESRYDSVKIDSYTVWRLRAYPKNG